MVDVFLIIVTIVLTILLIAANFYLLALYCHKDDKGWGAATYCKVMVILGMTLCWAQVLMLPLDIANSQNGGAGFDMITFWYVIMMIILVMITVLLPFAQFMYETDEDDTVASRLCTALGFTIGTVVVAVLALMISWIFFKYADIPIQVVTNGNFVSSSTAVSLSLVSSQTKSVSSSMEIIVSFPIYCIAFMSFIGWFLLVIFGGVGLTALPFDLIREFTMRPVLMNAKEAKEKKELIQKKTVELIQIAKGLKEEEGLLKERDSGWWAKRKAKKELDGRENQLQVSVYELEKEFDIFELELRFSETQNTFLGPLVYIGKLILGIIFAIISLVFWIHILVFCVIDAHPFLNKMLTDLLEESAGFIATSIYAFLGLYLLWCTQKGNLKFGVRIPFIVTLHPMKENETWMNSFLFNVSTLLICSVAVTEFMVFAFSQYASLTDIDTIINAQVRHMRWFRYFYANQVFEIALLCWSGLTLLYLLIRRSDKPQVFFELRELERLRNERKDINKD